MSALRKSEPKSITDEVKDFYRKHLSTNEPPKTKAEFYKMKRLSWDVENLKKESRGISKTALGQTWGGVSAVSDQRSAFSFGLSC